MYTHTYLQIEHNAMSDGLDANTFFQAFFSQALLQIVYSNKQETLINIRQH